VSRRLRSSRRAGVDAVTPLIYLTATRYVLGAVAEVEVMAEHAGQLEDGLMLLDDLDRRWGSDGELAAIQRLDVGDETQVSWDTVLLLTVAPVAGTEVELVTRRARRTGPVELPSVEVRRAVAVELVARELTDAGCAAAAVAIGDLVLLTDSPVQAPFRLALRRPAPADRECPSTSSGHVARPAQGT
jgi:thiamine biosynthesis lipoprotein ApbE